MSTHITIIIPFYNPSQLLKRCISSLLLQTYKDWSCVMVNDCSSDDSPSIARSYLSDERFSYFDQPRNKGVSAARNIALDNIDLNDDYLMFIDADDWIDDDYLSRMADCAKRTDADIVTSIFSHDGPSYSFPCAFPHVKGEALLSGYEGTKVLVADRKLMSHSPTKLYRSSLWKDIRFPEGVAYMEDQATIFKVFATSKKILLTDMVGYHYWEASLNSGSRRPFSPKKVLDALYAYFESYFYDYPFFTEEEKGSMPHVSAQAIARCFLTLYPRFVPCRATKQEEKTFQSYLRQIHKHLMIFRFHPTSKKELLKKWAFICSPLLYRKLFYKFARK